MASLKASLVSLHILKVVQSNQKSKFKWISISFGVSVLLLLVKFTAYYLTQSNAILSDALESIINVIATGFAFYSVSLSGRPRDPNHPYGHGKIEYFSSGFEGALIIIAGVFIVIEAIQRLLVPQPVAHLEWGFGLLLLTVVVNGGLGYYLQKVGKKTSSEALMADGKHLQADSLSTVLILFGLVLIALTGLPWLDSAVSLVLSLVIFYHGFLLIRGSVSALMDETDPALLENVVNTIKANQAAHWIDVHNLRIQRYGSDLHIDCHLTLPRYWDLRKVHDAVHDFEEILAETSTGGVEIFVHSDPCLPDCCHYCRVENCPVRTEVFSRDIEWDIHNLSKNQKHFVETN
jgi:cation diffusion facilitator family transporter